ncbi:MAG: ribonuclease PH, partial [Vicinamibacteria bacterium]
VGRHNGQILLDLNYEEDSKAEVDMNVVKTGRGLFVEIQGTAESTPFGDPDLMSLLGAADKGIQDLIAIQKKVLGDVTLREVKKEKP